MRIVHLFSILNLIVFQAKQLESGDTGEMILGVMIESNIIEGRQDIPASGPSGLKYGQSVTGKASLMFVLYHPLIDTLQMLASPGNKRSPYLIGYDRVCVVVGRRYTAELWAWNPLPR